MIAPMTDEEFAEFLRIEKVVYKWKMLPIVKRIAIVLDLFYYDSVRDFLYRNVEDLYYEWSIRGSLWPTKKEQLSLVREEWSLMDDEEKIDSLYKKLHVEWNGKDPIDYSFIETYVDELYDEYLKIDEGNDQWLYSVAQLLHIDEFLPLYQDLAADDRNKMIAEDFLKEQGINDPLQLSN